ncbi:MAG: PIN domain-containing protein [Thermoplasmatota archaeon]
MTSDPEDRPFTRLEDLPRTCIILDANALLSPFQQNFNLDMELQKAAPGFEPVVPSSVVRELQMLMKDGDWRAKAALQLSMNYPCVEVKGKGDAPIFNLAVRTGWMVMTQDRKLRSSLGKKGIPVVLLRGKGHLQIMEP